MVQKYQLCLALDTASDVTSVACLDSMGHKSVVCETLSRGQGELLMQLIQNALKQIGKKPKDLTCVAVTIGPGSFTGVRIGLATARGLGLALKIPVLGVDNFTATAHAVSQRAKIVLESKRADYFVQNFNAKGKALNKPALKTATQLKKLAAFTACGSGAQRLAEEIGCKVLPISQPLALSAAQIALHSPQQTVAPHPLYLREADVSI